MAIYTGNNGRLSRKEIIYKNKSRDELEKDYQTDFKNQIQQKGIQKCKSIAGKSPDE